VQHRVSAETGEGIDGETGLRAAILAMLTEVQGRPGERRWPVSALRVRDDLRTLKDGNAAAFAEAERTGTYVEPPDPVISKKQFEALVRKHAVKGGAYHEDPGQVLTLLHRSGFLYASERMPDQVILDQRWAVQGIYTVFDRASGAWRKLVANEGKFTGRNLRDWAWNEAGYSEREQATFLGMMVACGICFELLPDWVAAGGEAVAVAGGSGTGRARPDGAGPATDTAGG